MYRNFYIIGIIALLVTVVFCKSHGTMEKWNVVIMGIENRKLTSSNNIESKSFYDARYKSIFCFHPKKMYYHNVNLMGKSMQ